MIAIKNCPVCNSKKFTLRFRKSTNPVFNTSKAKEYRIVRCDHCRFIFVSPRPTAGELEQFYANQEVFFIGSGENELQDYLKSSTKYQKYYLSRVKKLEDMTKGRKILEVGSAGGVFLHTARQRGWEVLGIEPSTWGAKVANEKLGVKTIVGNYEHVKIPEHHFDAICFYDVIEHLTEPAKAIEFANNVLKPQGIVAISLPNVSSLWARVGNEKWSMYSLPEHLNYFDVDTLTRLLKRKGFKIIKAETRSAPGSFALISLINYFRGHRSVSTESNSEKDYEESSRMWKKYIKKSLDYLMIPFLFVINKTGYGEGLEIYARKIK